MIWWVKVYVMLIPIWTKGGEVGGKFYFGKPLPPPLKSKPTAPMGGGPQKVWGDQRDGGSGNFNSCFRELGKPKCRGDKTIQ